MFDQGFEVIVLHPHNFAEIVAKTANTPDPITAKDCETQYQASLANNQQAFVYILRLERRD